jgi:myo-inositol 2-dehydrogenase/D-chiro-inositol 1-dehydrogenase
MNENHQVTPQNTPPVSRRQFLKSSTLAAAATAAAVNFPSVLHAQAGKPFHAVVIGLGGRGGGAGKNFLDAAKIVGVEAKIVATADIFPEQAKRGKDAFGVPEDKCFSGFDAYVKALEVPGVNYAILASPPGFRAPHFKACIAAGKHVFMEKPVAVDGPGARIMYAAGEEAKQKNLKVAAGTQRRHQAAYLEAVKRVQDGMIGDVIALRAYWVNGGPIWHRGLKGDTDLERQIRNWYHYIWLCGDHICEQHVHDLDVCNWIMGNAHPTKCWGMGARQQLGEQAGEIWDNFAAEFEYANGVRMYSYCGQIKREWASVSEAVLGSKGSAEFNGGRNIIKPKAGVAPVAAAEPSPVIAVGRPDPFGVKGATQLLEHRSKPAAQPAPTAPQAAGTAWRFTGQAADPYMQEHVDLINAILKDTPLNEARQVTDSTLTAIMGREAAYSGAAVEWDQVLNSTWKYGPDLLYTDAAKMTWGEFRTLKPPMPSKHNIFKDPPMVAGA